jgi:hypothetical protein
MNQYISYIIAFSLVNLFLVYLLNLPTIITGANNLVQEYYYTHGIYHYFFDLILIGIYIAISKFFINLLNIKNNKVLVVALTTLIISSFFMIGFLSYPKNSTFFSRWFYKTKFKAVIYDIILVSSIYLTNNYLLS